MLKFGVVPQQFGCSVVSPLVKNKDKSVNDASNYRPISIISIASKIFEACLFARIESKLVTHPNQFGFVKNEGCNKALYMFTNTVKYTLLKEKAVCISVHLMQQKHLIA